MKTRLILIWLPVSLILSPVTMAQRKKQRTDSLAAYREFTRLGEWYQQLPLHINLRFVHKTTGSAMEDSTGTDMTLYYGKNDFYMLAEGMEQIVNDTLLVLVNNEVKMIKLYPNNKAIQDNLQRSFLLFTSDSSFDKLVQHYAASIQDEGQNKKRITLESREKVFGTSFPKESISILYQAETYKPLSCNQSKRSLVPVDSTSYSRLINEKEYKERLVSAKVNDGTLFFMVKEQYTSCLFNSISRDPQEPPVRQQDRVIRTAEGTYQPVKGFEDYTLSKEF